VAPERGQVWLAEAPGARLRRLVVVLVPDADGGRATIVAPLGRAATAAAGRVALQDQDGVADGGTVLVGRLFTLHPDDLVARVAMLPPQRVEELDSALRHVLGIETGTAPSPAVDAATTVAAALPEPALPPVPQPITTSAAPAPPMPKPMTRSEPPPPPPDRSAAPQVVPWDDPVASARLEDHPMARLFGQSQPARSVPDPSGSRPATAAGAARVLPELLDVVRRRLHRSSPRLEGLLAQAADEGRSVAWTAAAVRRASVRGVMQSTLDDIAAEMESVAAGGHAAV
jgi:mRNA-degrading endonuclease toxin of MazEF toxin-antitoxin module